MNKIVAGLMLLGVISGSLFADNYKTSNINEAFSNPNELNYYLDGRHMTCVNSIKFNNELSKGTASEFEVKNTKELAQKFKEIYANDFISYTSVNSIGIFEVKAQNSYEKNTFFVYAETLDGCKFMLKQIGAKK